MSTSDKPDLARGWRWAEKLVDEEADRIAAMSDEEFEREAAAMPDPEHLPTEAELDARGARRRAEHSQEQSQRPAKPPAVVEPLPKRRSFIWLVAAAFVALLVLIAVKRDELIALFRHQPISPLPSEEPLPRQPPDHEMTSLERANALRVEAYGACGRASWTICESKLDEARTLDPSGEHDPNVRRARREISDALYPDAASIPRDTKLAPDKDQR